MKLKVAIPIIPMFVSYELESNVPKFVADRNSDLKMLVMKGKIEGFELSGHIFIKITGSHMHLTSAF